MGRYFGTDGFRGEAGVSLTAEQSYKIGRFLGGYRRKNDGRIRVVIGKDTRRSSYMLEYALASGIAASGADAYMLHVTTTPSVSFVAAGDGFDYGIMISASHNHYADNGIKILNSRGEKIDDDTIAEVEAYIDGKEADIPLATGASVGEIVDYYAGRNRYIGYLISLSRYSFKGFRVGLDTANGGAWMIAKSVFDALGAETYVINAVPNGININENCGSTSVASLVSLVKAEGLDVGFAFDGDADRCIAVDECGEIVNGDKILYLLSNFLRAAGELSGNTVVTTVMSNLGLYKALDKSGVSYEKTAVGDRYVYDAMQKSGYSLGGEQSGHVILSKYATTGDGILTAVKVMEAMISSKLPLSKLVEPVKMLPQMTVNIRVRDKSAVMKSAAVNEAVQRISNLLQKDGRILLRESGTEPVVRVMVEAESESLCRSLCESVAEIIRAEA